MKILDLMAKAIMLILLLILFMFLTKLDEGLKEKYRHDAAPASAPPSAAGKTTSGDE